MSRPSNLGVVVYEQETTFGENAAMSSPVRLPTLGEVDLSNLSWEKRDLAYTRQYRNEVGLHALGAKGGSFTLRLPLTGHGTTTAGALTATAVATFLGRMLGNVSASMQGSTVVGSPSPTATAFTVAGGSFAAGQLCRVGTLGDGRGDGQAALIQSVSGSAITLATALPDPPAASDVVYAMLQAYPEEAPGSSALAGWRFLLATANQQILAHGCYPTAVRLTNLNAGESPQVEVELAVAWWEPVSETFPRSESVQTYTVQPVGAGSFFLQVAGTATRQTYSIRSFTLELDLQVMGDMGPDGAHMYQAVVAAKRHHVGARVTLVEDAPTASTTPRWYAQLDSTNRYTGLYTMSVADGRALALAFPSLQLLSQRQMAGDNFNRLESTWLAETNTDRSTTTDLYLSAWRLGLG